jgi:uncharacterized oxidoreductase
VTATVLVTGGGSGIGAALAAAFHARGAKVIVAGQTRARLEAVAARHPGMVAEVVDVADPDQVLRLATRIESRWPHIDTVISNAGVQTLFDFNGPAALDMGRLAREVDVNLKGVIYVANAFLPLLKRRARARLIHVGSGLGYVPLAAAPVYSATKAAVHSFTQSLRRQLRGGTVQVVEIIPPVVATDLHRGQAGRPRNAMPLEAFTAAAMAGLDSGREEIPVGLARILRVGSRIAPGAFMNIVNAQRE